MKTEQCLGARQNYTRVGERRLLEFDPSTLGVSCFFFGIDLFLSSQSVLMTSGAERELLPTRTKRKSRKRKVAVPSINGGDEVADALGRNINVERHRGREMAPVLSQSRWSANFCRLGLFSSEQISG